MNKKINWIEGEGGPHIIIESKFLKIWKGESDEEFERSLCFYKKACSINDYISVLNIGSGKCIIINEDILISTWITDNTGGILVVGNYIGDEMEYDTLSKEINDIPQYEYSDTELVYQVCDQELYLFPACDFDKGWHYNYCKFNLLPGNYIVKMIEEYAVNDSNFRLFKFTKTS